MKTVRKLNLSDIFKAANIFKKTGLKEEMRELITKSKSKKVYKISEEETAQVQEELGMNLIFTIVDRAPQVEEELYAFLGGLCDLDGEAMKGIEVTELPELFKDIAEKNDLESFFTQLMR